MAEAGNVHLGRVAGRVEGLEIVSQVIGVESFDRQRELEFLGTVGAEQPDENDLVPFRKVGEHEPGLLASRRYRTHGECVLLEKHVHPPVCATHGE